MTARSALVWIVLRTGLACCTSPAMAQTYDPNYPIWIETYSIGGGYINCSFTSMPQCKATASGRGGNALIIHISRRVCSQRSGADVRPDFNWNKTSTALMGHRVK